MTTPLQRLSYLLLAAFTLVALALGYWVVGRGSSLLARDDNPRRVLAEQRIRRGQIVDRNGTVLAESLVDPESGFVERCYPYPAAAPVVGYYSLRYGVSGVEAEYDNFLRGEAQLGPWEEAKRQLLHQAPIGGDIRLTLDLDTQQAAAEALAGRRGAIVVVTAPAGEVLAAASAPSFDPNQLDEAWEVLIHDASAPLINRATQGAYQPGTILQSVVLGTALNTGTSQLDDVWASPLTVAVEGMILPCAETRHDVETLADAYILACPAPFQAVAERIGAHQLENALSDFGLLAPPSLFNANEEIILEGLLSLSDPASVGIGQSNLTVNPLQMALVGSAFSNHGQIPPAHLVTATRTPGGQWEPVPAAGNPRGTISRASADAIASLMRDAVERGAAHEAGRSVGQAYGHAGLAVAGAEERYNAWFIGFAYRAAGDAVAIAVLLEDTQTAGTAARIGGEVLQAALASQP